MADFEIAHKITVKNEGGYTDNPDDNGNWTGGKKGVGVLVGTNYGISAPVLKEYLGRTPTVSDMKNMSTETADKIYKKRYWTIIRGDELTRQNVANSIYDSAVNMGCSQAIKLAQRAAGLPETGKMNNETLKALNV